MKRLVMLLLCAGLVSVVQAEDTPGGCVEARVDGYKAPDYGCLSQQMGGKAAQKNREAREKPVHQRPPNQIGLSTPAATSVRMGNTFGTGVKAQRP